MKILSGSLLVALIFLFLWLGRDTGWTVTPPAYRELDPEETTPELVKVGQTWPLQNGSSLWFRPGNSSYGTVLKTDGDHILVKLAIGDITWLERHQIRGSFIAKTK